MALLGRILPSQYYGSFGSVGLSGEQRLMLAFLVDAINVLRSWNGDGSPRKRRNLPKRQNGNSPRDRDRVSEPAQYRAAKMLEGFDFGAPKIGSQLAGRLGALRGYNGLGIPAEYFDAAMERLRDKYLNVLLAAVLHTASATAQRAATEQKAAAVAAPPVREKELAAQQWFERWCAAADLNEQVRFYSELIRLKRDYANALNNRGIARRQK
jgi:hypothetical protein